MVTQEQIARKLGVSRQLVTFALAGYPQVSAKSRQRILAAAREMGYRPNPHARALRRQRTGIVALWIPDQISTHYTQVARELGRLAREARHELIIAEVEAADAQQVLSHVPVDAIIAVDALKAVQRQLEGIEASTTPVVSVGAYCSPKTDRVEVDLTTGTAAVMKHLLDAGFQRIAHATFVRKDQPGESRRLGYVEAMRAAGRTPEFIYYPLTRNQKPVTRRLIQEYIKAEGRPDAIFCHSDDAALGIYRGLCDLGLRVPQDVALVGCDGIEDTEYLECPLTTLVQPVAEMCATAWRFVQERLEQADRPRQQVVLQPQLAVRASTQRK